MRYDVPVFAQRILPGTDGTPRSQTRVRAAVDARETLIRIVLPALLIYAALCLASTRRELYAAGREEAALRARLTAVEEENLAASRRLAEGWSAEELEALARERLGLVLPGDRIFRFTAETQAASPEKAEGSGAPGSRERDTETTDWIIASG